MLLFTKVITVTIGFIGFYFVTHYMGPEVLGVVGFASSFVGFFSLFMDPGLNTTHIKMVRTLKDLGKCNGTFLFIKFILVIATVFLIVISLKIYQSSVQQDKIINGSIIYITIIGAVAGYIYNSIKTIFSSLILTAKQELPEYLSLIAIPMKVFIAIREMGAFALASINSLGMILSCGASIYLFKNTPLSLPSREIGKKYISFAFPIALVDISRIASSHIDRIILQIFWGPLYVGYMYAAQRIIGLLDYLFKSINQIFFPLMAELQKKEDLIGTNKLLNKAIFNLVLFLLPTVIMLSFFSNEVIYLLVGENFLQSSDILIVLSIWVLISGLNKLYQNTIIAWGYNVFYAKIGVIISLLAIVSNILLIPKSIYGIKLFGLGVIGAALSLLISSFIGLIINIKFLKKFFNYNFEKRLLIILFSGLCQSFILYLFKSETRELGFIITLLSIICSLTIYILISYILGAITKRDMLSYRLMMNPNAMRKYISSELGNNNIR